MPAGLFIDSLRNQKKANVLHAPFKVHARAIAVLLQRRLQNDLLGMLCCIPFLFYTSFK
jgi:hypothetical protein